MPAAPQALAGPDIPDAVAQLVHDVPRVPAVPALPGVGENKNEVTTPGGTVTGSCRFLTTLPQTSFDDMNVAIVYTVTADAPAFAVGGVCEIVDATGYVWGELRTAMSGSAAATAGNVAVSRHAQGVLACNTPTATWPDGTPGNPTRQRTCTPL